MINMYEYKVYGVVQGVGFRPYVYRLAKEHGLVGIVRNEDTFVRIIVNDSCFETKLKKNPPILSKIDRVEIEKIELIEEIYTDFRILESKRNSANIIIPPDVNMCSDCARELKDPNDRRFGYYFITCTNCGPRFSIVKNSPYDRDTTSMDEFEMCDECKSEYTNPLNRRYHAQTIACKSCGPRLFFYENGNKILEDSAIEKCVEKIKSGELVSIKGVGGFHIVSTVLEIMKLREFAYRENKPFALMAKLEIIKEYCYVDSIEEELLLSKKRPIVLLRKKDNRLNLISEIDTLGFMLPYTPLHELIFDNFNEPLIFTSCNLPDEPIESEVGLTNHVLDNERRIVNKVDDSILKVIEGRKLFIRRGRGFTPTVLDVDSEDLVCLGAEMNSSFTIVKGKKAYISQYLGNTSNDNAFVNYKTELDKWLKWVQPDVKKIVCDMHPNYNTSRYANELANRFNCNIVRMQHHEAHLSSVALENPDIKDFIGVSFDGMGYGLNGSIYGGEIYSYIHNDNSFKRVGTIETYSLIGGDSATKNPKKILYGILKKFSTNEEIKKLELFDKEEIEIISKQLISGFNVFETTSIGRIIDAAAVLIGVCEKNDYDARCAMLLESNAKGVGIEIEPEIIEKEGLVVLQITPLFKYLFENLDKEKEILASTTLEYISNGFIKMVERLNTKRLPVLFSGGVSYNKQIAKKFFSNGYITNSILPCGDGNISFGQTRF